MWGIRRVPGKARRNLREGGIGDLERAAALLPVLRRIFLRATAFETGAGQRKAVDRIAQNAKPAESPTTSAKFDPLKKRLNLVLRLGLRRVGVQLPLGGADFHRLLKKPTVQKAGAFSPPDDSLVLRGASAREVSPNSLFRSLFQQAS